MSAQRYTMEPLQLADRSRTASVLLMNVKLHDFIPGDITCILDIDGDLGIDAFVDLRLTDLQV